MISATGGLLRPKISSPSLESEREKPGLKEELVGSRHEATGDSSAGDSGSSRSPSATRRRGGEGLSRA